MAFNALHIRYKRTSIFAALTISCFCLFGFFVVPLPTTVPPTDTLPPVSNNELLLEGVDGPYLFRKRNKIREVRVVSTDTVFQIQECFHSSKEPNSFTCVVENEERDSFTFQLIDKIRSPRSRHKQPEKMLAISDIEGNFNAFYSLLVGNGVMDTAYNWTYGNGHLVLVGDFVDRGINVTQCLWLIYKLEQEAEKAGGMVHFILGNHEVMNFQGMTNYVDKKYLALAHRLSGDTDEDKAFRYLMSNQRELVRWMKSKNVIERIGSTIFVHGGLSKTLLTANLSLGEINEFMRYSLNRDYFSDPAEESLKAFLLGPMGPLWYRGLIGRYKSIYQKATHKEVKTTLKYFQATEMVIGHTVVENVKPAFDGMVYCIDIGFPPFKFTGKAQGLLIEKDQFYRVTDMGEQFCLSE